MLTKNHAKLTSEVARHIAADAVIQSAYWTEAKNDIGGRGCFIGCLAHGSDPKAAEVIYGLPEALIRLCEAVFERLLEHEAQAFFAAIPDAVDRDGRDLSRVHWKVLGQILRDLPDVPQDVQAVIDPVIEGMDLLAAGKDWPAAAHAAHAARAAARAAHAAAHANTHDAHAAAHAAAATVAAHANTHDAARAARAAAVTVAAHAAAHAAAADDYPAAVRRQRDIILTLIREA